MAKKETKEVDLANLLADSLNKQSKDQMVAYFLDGTDAPTNVEGWISTGAAMLDVAILGRIGQTVRMNRKRGRGSFLLQMPALTRTDRNGRVIEYAYAAAHCATEFTSLLDGTAEYRYNAQGRLERETGSQ